MNFILLSYRPSLYYSRWSIHIAYSKYQLPKMTVVREAINVGHTFDEDVRRDVDKDSVTTRAMDEAVFDQLRVYCQNLRLPAIPAGVYGRDGETYTLKFKDGFNESTFTWWCDLPRNWQELQYVKDTLMKWAEITPSEE